MEIRTVTVIGADAMGSNVSNGSRVAPMLFNKKIAEAEKSRYILPWTRQAVLDAYLKKRLNGWRYRFFETHDCFMSSEYAAVSSFEITGPGNEYQAIEDGVTSFEGSKPVNASGGLIGYGHPVGASGVRMFLDVCISR